MPHRLLVLCVLSVLTAARAATFTVSGTTLQLNLTAANEAVAITAGASSYTFALTGGTWSGTNSADATGNGTASLSAVKASFTAVTVDDSSTGNGANFNDSGANTYTASFTITLDSATPGTSTFSGTTAFTGSNALSLQSGAVLGNSGSIVSTVDGNLTLLGNMQTPGQTGNLFGIFLNNTRVTVSGFGNLTMKGKSGISTNTVAGVKLFAGTVVTGGIAGSTLTVEGYGAASSTRNYGVNLADAGTTITSAGGNVVVTGVGGSSSTFDNKGILLETSTSILATGSGSLTITGTGGGTNSATNTGVEMQSGTQIATVDGTLSVTGTGGGGAAGTSNRGVQVGGSIKSTGSGSVSVVGIGGPGSGGDNQGVLLERFGTGTVQEIKSATGSVSVTGTAGGGTGSVGIKVNSVAAAAATISAGGSGSVALVADSMSLVTSAVISAASVSVAPLTPGKSMDLGSASDSTANTLGLSQAELNTITASTLNLGDANTALISVSTALTLPAGTTANVTAAIINTNGNTVSGGTVWQTTAGQPDISVTPLSGAFGSLALGSTQDLVFTLSNVGFVDLTGISVSLAGANQSEFTVFATPAATVAAGGSTTFAVRFAPATLGSRVATVQIASNDPDENPAIINLTGFSPSTSPLSGTKSVGPTGFYASLTQAITDIQTAGLGGALVLELEPAYLSTVETFPLTIPALTGASATNTLTIRPASGATALSISSANTTAATVDLNGAQFVTFDGRPGGTGTDKQLTIENTSTLGVALRFINEASNNTLQFLTVKSVNTSAGSGSIFFSTTTGANGNDNNTIDNCDIGDGASTPANGIYSFGTTTTSAQNNSGNTVTNCNVFNFYRGNNNSAGVLLITGNTDWTISGNSFYQTTSRTATIGITVNAIGINNSQGNNFTISGNFIGGSAPTCGGTAWTTTGTGTTSLFQGIRLFVGSTIASSVQGNTIANLVWTSSSNASALPGVWCGIYVATGNVNIGTVTGNTVGSGTGTGSISVTTTGNGGTTFGIGSPGSGTLNIANNAIGSITTNGAVAPLTGISVTAGTNTISNNTVGSTTTANSLNGSPSSTSVTGILSSSTVSTSITGNTVANLNNNFVGTSSNGFIRGIVTVSGVNTITGNTVRNLSTTSQNPATTMTAVSGPSVVGIADISTTAGQTVSQNTVHSLANTAATAAVNVTGIYYSGATTGTNLIARNFVHSLAVSSSSTSSSLNGMQFAAGTFTAQNNMVCVGLDASGTSTAGASTVRGIYDNGTTSGRNFYHNSVYLGGTQTSSAANTAAFQSTGTTNTRDYRNNLFVNARSNSGATNKHYAVSFLTSVGSATVNNNLYLASGTGGVLGLFNSADRTTLAAWQTATGRDTNSLSSDPLFVNPLGDAATVDLHLQGMSPAIGAADTVASVGVTDDYDAQLRSLFSPVIGADARISTNANLSALTLSAGTLTFSANTLAYTLTVPNTTPSTTVTATPAFAGATLAMQLNGGGFTTLTSGTASNALALNVGTSMIDVKVTAQDGTTVQTYTITVTRNSAIQDWAATNGVNPNGTGANGLPNLQNFAFGVNPVTGGNGTLQYTGTFAGGGTVTATGQPTTAIEPTTDGLDFRALFVRRTDHATAGLTYTAQFSANLGTWQDNALAVTVLADDGVNQIVSVPYPPFVGGKKARFFRVSVSIAP